MSHRSPVHSVSTLDLPVYYEPVQDNAYLADLYRDTKRHSLCHLIYLLKQQAFQQHQEIIWRGGGGVQDRTIYEDSVFAKMLVKFDLMEERDHEFTFSLTYAELHVPAERDHLP